MTTRVVSNNNNNNNNKRSSQINNWWELYSINISHDLLRSDRLFIFLWRPTTIIVLYNAPALFYIDIFFCSCIRTIITKDQVSISGWPQP